MHGQLLKGRIGHLGIVAGSLLSLWISSSPVMCLVSSFVLICSISRKLGLSPGMSRHYIIMTSLSHMTDAVTDRWVPSSSLR